MSRRKGTVRIDYPPGPRARAALELAAQQFPKYGIRDLLDMLVINGQSALAFTHWRPAVLHGRNRHYWHPPAGPEPVTRQQASTFPPLEPAPAEVATLPVGVEHPEQPGRCINFSQSQSQ